MQCQLLFCQSSLLIVMTATTLIKAINFSYIKQIHHLSKYIKRILFIELFSNN